MKTIVYVLLGLLVLPVWSNETPPERINAEELREISQKRKVVVIISKEGKQLEGKVLEYDGESVLFQRQKDLQLFRFDLTGLAQQSQRMIKDNYMTANYNVPKLQRPLQENQIKKFAHTQTI